MSITTINARDLHRHIEAIDAEPRALMAMGRPVCPACQVLDAGLEVIADARPDLPVYVVNLETDDDWAARETVLWPRDIRVSRSTTPAMVLLQHGHVVARRQGAAPAHDVDGWIARHFGPAATPVAQGITDAEQAVLDRTTDRRAQHLAVKAR